MDINNLIAIVKKKIEDEIVIEKILIEDKSFLHKKHQGNQKGKFHLKITIHSKELKNLNRIDGNKKIYKVIKKEMNLYIHSLQILIY
ncbi:BolA/IbaG family iron-sulfur metabolism protein [Candidatus Pelagibacter communis]|uniref:BolA/IbaG family iron-sulfur metabolism protein n=1 Tax=Pelagibacter ubique TaxID=198252 RepID=UPI0009E375B5|nr:BolA/IbaG family iron-sulfur metabolism protein [Candidatus Pelagibacter ubique]